MSLNRVLGLAQEKQPEMFSGNEDVLVECKEDISSLSASHQAYLIQRHGTCDLNPLPSENPGDPLNWPAWKKNVNLALITFHGMMCTFQAVGVTPAIGLWSKTYHLAVEDTIYLATGGLITLATGPLFWVPIANRFGRRPVWLISAIGAGLFNIGASLSQDYATHLVMRIIGAFFISPGVALVLSVVIEMFFARNRGQKMGIWIVFVNAGTSLGPLTMGFVIEFAGWRWVYRIFAIINFTVAALFFLFSPETLYMREAMRGQVETKQDSIKREYLKFGRIDPKPLTLNSFLEPLYLLKNVRILIIACAYAVAHNFVLTLLLVEVSGLYISIFKLKPQQVGLNYISLLVGCLLGEQLAGPLSDYLRNRQIKKSTGSKLPPQPEDRLWISHLGFPLVIAGVTIFFVRIAEAKPHQWNITPTIGCGIAAFGVQIPSTILITYCSDLCPRDKAASLGVAINFLRLIWGFVSPFWYPHMIKACGLRGSAGLIAGLMIVFAIFPVVFIQMWGKRDKKRMEADL